MFICLLQLACNSLPAFGFYPRCFAYTPMHTGEGFWEIYSWMNRTLLMYVRPGPSAQASGTRIKRFCRPVWEPGLVMQSVSLRRGTRIPDTQGRKLAVILDLRHARHFYVDLFNSHGSPVKGVPTLLQKLKEVTSLKCPGAHSG